MSNLRTLKCVPRTEAVIARLFTMVALVAILYPLGGCKKDKDPNVNPAEPQVSSGTSSKSTPGGAATPATSGLNADQINAEAAKEKNPDGH